MAKKSRSKLKLIISIRFIILYMNTLKNIFRSLIKESWLGAVKKWKTTSEQK
jgi:hypothetical protein